MDTERLDVRRHNSTGNRTVFFLFFFFFFFFFFTFFSYQSPQSHRLRHQRGIIPFYIFSSISSPSRHCLVDSSVGTIRALKNNCLSACLCVSLCRQNINFLTETMDYDLGQSFLLGISCGTASLLYLNWCCSGGVIFGCFCF